MAHAKTREALHFVSIRHVRFRRARDQAAMHIWNSLTLMSERRNFWDAILCTKFKKLPAVAVMLLFMHTTSCSAERNWSKWGLIYEKNRACLARERAMKTISLTEHHGFRLDAESDALFF